MKGPFKLTRRELVLSGIAAGLAGGTGLVLGVYAGGKLERRERRVPDRVQPFAPNVFLAIDERGDVTVWLTKSEMGQGVSTALPMLIAEELEADFARVRIEHAIANANYGNQRTVGSGSVRSLWDELRTAGAAAREMLIAAGAASLGVPPTECAAEKSQVLHRTSGRRVGYGELVQRAAALPVPKAPRLKAPGEFRLLGRDVPRLDLPAKLDGSAVFGLDVRVPGMLFAAVVHRPTFGAKLLRYRDERARALPGVRHVVAITHGVAVVADTTFIALQARGALEVEWENGPAHAFDDAALDAAFAARRDVPGRSARSEGDAARVLDAAQRKLEVDYAVPYLAHATMEPINCTAHVRPGRCEIWAPTQSPQGAQKEGARITGLPLPEVIVHVPLLGGGFGRRAEMLEVIEAVEIAKQIDAPVQVVWSREDDIRHDRYRPAVRHRLAAALSADGKAVEAVKITVYSQSFDGTPSEEALDGSSVEGIYDFPYPVPNIDVAWVSVDLPVKTGAWRSIGHSFNAFVAECFADELAHALGQDPLEYRRAGLRGAPRQLAVLERAAELAGWGSAPPEGRARGIAVHTCYGSYVAMVAEVSRDASGKPRVHRVSVAADCGLIAHPDGVRAQLEGGLVFGLSAALYGRIGFAGGSVQQSNFHDYPLLRIDEMPEVEVALIPSAEAPGGAGELGVPPIAPAVCNALFSLTGERIRKLPIVG
jgi:isoquinoline 1-oxidoreductase beta subunit